MDLREYSKKIHFYDDRIPQTLLRCINNVKWKSYLDLGCGDGSLLQALDKKGFFINKKVFAIDLSEIRISRVKNLNKCFECYVNDACNIENIRDNAIDLITSSQVIEHVNDDKAMIEEIKRVLNLEGVVFISTVFKKKYGWYFYRCNGKWTLDPTHVREYTDDSQLLDVITDNGFKILYTNKSLIKMPLIDFFLRKIGFKQNIIQNSFLNYLRRITIPIFGYYNWEIVFKLKGS